GAGRCRPRAYRVGRSQLWAPPNRASYDRAVVGRSVTALALAMVALAAVMLPIGVARHCGTREPAAPRPPRTPQPPPVQEPAAPPIPDDALIAAMFGAVCRHPVACGTGDLARCPYV